MIIETPSGYKVHLRETLTFGQKRLLQRTLLSAMKLDAGKGSVVTMKDMDSSKALDIEEQAFGVLCDKIEADGKTISSDFWAVVQNWSEADGQVVFDAVDKIVFPKTTEQEKKSV